MDATLLHSHEAEQAVLGCLLSRPETIDQAREFLQVDDFFAPAHKELYRALLALHDARRTIEPLTVHQFLADKGIAESLGSPGLLGECLTRFTTHLNLDGYITIVRDKSLLRKLFAAATTITELLQTGDSVEKILDQAETAVFAITNTATRQTTVPISSECDPAHKQILDMRAGRIVAGLATGFHALNELTTGWKAGEMIVLAARPGQGKTALALNFARTCASMRLDAKKSAWVTPGLPIGFFSLEMTNRELYYRILSAEASEPLQPLRQGQISDESLEHITTVAARIKRWPLYLDDSSALTINQLRAKARRMKDQYKIAMLIVDYLQLLRSESKQSANNRQNEVAEISRGIKSLAKELAIPIIILAQLNRKSEESGSEPALHNLRESGAIEQDADVVMLLHRHELEEGAAVSPIKEYSLIVAKQRNGPTDKIPLLFHASYTRFEDPARR